MKTYDSQKWDRIGGVVFGALTITFVLLMALDQTFFDWAWARHYNILSWYVRSVSLLPFIYFAYRRSWTGMAFSVFAIATSMAWFPAPAGASANTTAFLAMEEEYLFSAWNLSKILLTLTVPLMFALLAVAFWNRNFIYGGVVIVIAVLMKIVWSLIEGGTSGWALVPIALVGLLITLGLIYLGYRRHQD
jgi:hypothetical protein